ncbi:MAG: hypothetical protein KGS72_28015 [Cyanobacteria bacterium REEB67]|nr:hypothetical protein [Cyanobacteria bacterium REEB67]
MLVYSSLLSLLGVNLLGTPALTLSLLTLAPAPCRAATDEEFDAGLAAYKTQHYQLAVDHFSKSIQAGNKTSAVFLYSGHCFANLNQLPRAYKTYEIVTTAFKGTPEATTAADLMNRISLRLGQATPTAAATTAAAAPAVKGAAPAPAGASTAATEGLLSRINVFPPCFGHPAVSAASINAAQQAVKALPKPLRKKLDDSDASIVLAPNMVDRWNDSLKDLNEESEELNMAELPGRIYGHEMCIYERAKRRGSNDLKEARPPLVIKLQVGNMCFQVLDEMMAISKDPACRKEWEADCNRVPDNMQAKLATFMKADEWGPRETCSELFGSMIGGHDDNTDDLYRYFPGTKKWLKAKMGL